MLGARVLYRFEKLFAEVTLWHQNGMKAANGKLAWGFHDIVTSYSRTGRWTYWDPDGNVDEEKSGIYEYGQKVGK